MRRLRPTGENRGLVHVMDLRALVMLAKVDDFTVGEGIGIECGVAGKRG